MRAVSLGLHLELEALVRKGCLDGADGLGRSTRGHGFGLSTFLCDGFFRSETGLTVSLV